MKNLFSKGRWNRLEKEKFLQSLSLKNFSWINISRLIGTRSPAQCRSHYQKMIIGERLKKANNLKTNSLATMNKESIVKEKVEKIANQKFETLNLQASSNDSSTEDRSESIYKKSPEFTIEKDFLETVEEYMNLEFYPECNESHYEYYNF